MKMGIAAGFFLIALASASATDKYIRADVANLRKKPAATSEMVFRIRINSPVVEKQRQGDWSLVRFGPLTEGWIQSGMLGDAPFTKANLLDSLKHATDKPTWAGRLVAAFPEEEKNWDALMEAFRERADEKGMAMVKAHKEGREVAYIAVCNGGTMQLLGKLDEEGNFKSYAWQVVEGVTDPPKGIAKSTAISATGQRWYSVAGPVPDSLFNVMKKGPSKSWMQAMKKTRPSYQMYLEGFDTTPNWYEMGTCRDEEVYVSRPIVKGVRKAAAPMPITRQSLWKKFRSDDTSTGSVAKPYLKVKPYPEVGLNEVIVNFNYLGHYGPSDEDVTALIDEKGGIVYPNGPVSCVDYMDGEEKKFNTTRFFSLAGDNGKSIYGLFMYVAMSAEGGELKLDLIKLDGSGKAEGFNIFSNYQGG